MSSNKPKRRIDEIFELKRALKEKDETIKKLYAKLHNYEKAEKKEFKTVPKKQEILAKLDSDCPECNTGKLKSTYLGFRTLISCDVCKYRKTIKSND